MKLRLGYILSCAVLMAVVFSPGAGATEPRVFGFSAGTLPNLKARLAKGDKDLQPAMEQLLNEATAALEMKPISVVEKPRPPASGDKHDYLSIGPYWWPDPSKSNGLPYIRKDGRRNPETKLNAYDRSRLDRVVTDVETLALAYYLVGKADYAKHAASLLRTFFLDPATRMNPNMNYAQAIPGKYDGRGIGMIESYGLAKVADATALLETSPAWGKADQQAMDAWFHAFVDWACDSKNGREERAAKNNHGTFYDVQVAHLALHLGRSELAREILEKAKTARLGVQIKADGSQPLELAREDSFGYSVANLRGCFMLATLGEHVGVDLWYYRTPQGAGIQTAVDFLLPYVENPGKPWPYEHSVTPNHSRLALLLPQAYAVYHDERYRRVLSQISDHEKQRDTLWFPDK